MGNDPEIRENLVRHLTLKGYRTLATSDGVKGLWVYKKEKPDIILSESRMPMMDGFTFLDEVRKIDPYAEFVLVTANGDMEMAMGALCDGASDFIPEPVQMDTLDVILSRSKERLAVRRELKKEGEVRREAQRGLQKAHDELEIRVGERTAELEETIKELQRKISEHKRAEAEILDQKEYTENIFTTVPSGLVVVRPDLSVKSTNLSWREMDPDGKILPELLEGIKDMVETGGHAPRRRMEFEQRFDDKYFNIRLGSIKIPKKKTGNTGGDMLRYTPEFEDEFVLGLTYAPEQLMVIDDITERKRAEKEIKRSLREKEVLLKEVHHRVKNNLQVISSLLYLQSKSIVDKDLLEMFNISRNRVKSMALIHEKLYQTGDYSRIDFGDYIRKLTNFLFRSYHVTQADIALKIDVEDVHLGVNTAIPCGLIINELMTNSLKYAFPDGGKGEIEIILRGDADNGFTLIVRDNGIGFMENEDFRRTESLGLKLVNNLVKQLDGTIELDTDGGAEWRINFPDSSAFGNISDATSGNSSRQEQDLRS